MWLKIDIFLFFNMRNKYWYGPMCTDTCYGYIVIIKVGLLWELFNLFCMQNSPVFALILAKESVSYYEKSRPGIGGTVKLFVLKKRM